MFILVLQRLFLESIGDMFYFPLWWYSKGLWRSFKWIGRLFMRGNETLAPGLWLANIFVPMYGQYDIQGRIISFFMRSAQIVGRSVALCVWLVLCLALLAAWIVLPAAALYGLVTTFTMK